MLASHQPLTAANGTIPNYPHPARKAPIQNVATPKWADPAAPKIQVSLKKVFMLLYSDLNYNRTHNYHN